MGAGCAQVNLAFVNVAVGSLNEAEIVDTRIYAKAGDKADVRSFRTFDRAEAAVVRVVYVADLESCPVAGKTAGTKGAETPLVRYFGKRVGLIHELAQLTGAEERIDDA